MGKRTSRKVRKPSLQLAPDPYVTLPEDVDAAQEVIRVDESEEQSDTSAATGPEPTQPARADSGFGLTSLETYYEEPSSAPAPEPYLTSAQLNQIRDDVYEERFGRPVHEHRDGVMARLEDKLRST